MKLSMFAALALVAGVLFSCGKDDMDIEKKMKNMEVCSWDEASVSDTAEWDIAVLEPLVVDASCGCYASGVVRYVKKDENGEPSAPVYLVKYGVDEEDCSWAVLFTCEDGKCDMPHRKPHHGKGKPHHGKPHHGGEHHGEHHEGNDSMPGGGGCHGGGEEHEHGSKPEVCKFQQTNCATSTPTSTSGTGSSATMSRMSNEF